METFQSELLWVIGGIVAIGIIVYVRKRKKKSGGSGSGGGGGGGSDRPPVHRR